MTNVLVTSVTAEFHAESSTQKILKNPEMSQAVTETPIVSF